MVTVIFPAAGQGRRMGAKRNKVLMDLLGKPILVHTLLTFSRCDLVDDLIVVVGKEDLTPVRLLLHALPGIKPCQVVEGGSERQYSIANGLAALDRRAEIVLVHDAARPLVSDAVIRAVIEEARRGGAAIAAVPAKDTIKVADAERLVAATPERHTLWTVQTPQGFRRSILLDAYEKAAAERYLGTDDSCLVERLGVKVKLVESDYQNIKITTPEDMLIAEAFMRRGVVSKVVSGVSSVVEEVKEKIWRRG